MGNKQEIIEIEFECSECGYVSDSMAEIEYEQGQKILVVTCSWCNEVSFI